jgi:hypothetical protein
MIRLPVSRRTRGGGDGVLAARETWRVEWDDRDDDGKKLPRRELVARFVTSFGTASRRIRLRLSDETGD